MICLDLDSKKKKILTYSSTTNIYMAIYPGHPIICISLYVIHCTIIFGTIILCSCPEISYCPKLSLYYGYVKHYGYTHGSKAYHYCNSCYKLYGDRVRVCKYGYWSGKAPVCKGELVACREHTIVNNYMYNVIELLTYT